VDGETLEARPKRQGRLSVTETVDIFSKFLNAIDYAYSKKAVHGDSKPGNITRSRRPLPLIPEH
jgi:serine/threonine protein kinase